MPALHECGAALAEKAKEWEKILKIGRTHLIDATPLSLGQEIGGMARQLDRSVGPRRRWPWTRCWNCPSAERRWAAASTPIRSSPAGSARSSPRRPASPSSRRSITSRPTPSATAWSSATASSAPSPPRSSPWPTTSAGSVPGRRCGFHEISPARPPAGQLDHARQGQPGDVREPDAGRRAGDRQRRRRSPSAGRPAASSS